MEVKIALYKVNVMYMELVRTKGEERGAAEQLTRQLTLTFGPRAGAQQARPAGPARVT